MTKIEWTKERIIIAAVIGGLVAIIGLYFILYQPLIIKVTRAGRECRSAEGNLKNLRNDIISYKNIDKKRFLINEEDISSAIDELTRAAKIEGINFSSLAPQAVAEADGRGYKIVPVKIELKSSYEKLGKFLGTLDDLERTAVGVREFSVIADKADREMLNISLVINIYVNEK